MLTYIYCCQCIGYKMKRNYFLQLIILFLGLLIPVSVFAVSNISAPEAEKWANSKGQEILRILADKNLDKKYAALDNILYNDIDLDGAAKFAVGKYWKKMTPQQQENYIPLFKRYISSLYKGYPLNLGEGSVNFSISKVLPTKDGADVWCNIQLKNMTSPNGNGFNVLFSLIKKRNKIQVRDLKIAESSLLRAFRDRFYKIIHTDNDDEIDWFLEDLETLTTDKEQKNMQNLENAVF